MTSARPAVKQSPPQGGNNMDFTPLLVAMVRALGLGYLLIGAALVVGYWLGAR